MALVAPFLIALLMPVAGRRLGAKVGWLALVAPLISFAALVSIAAIPPSERGAMAWNWLPSLGITLTFNPDGLALFFGLVVTGVGVLVTGYASSYLDDHARDHGRFYCYLLLFMGAMLLTVFSANLLVLFVAWELTGITSFLLIGFLHEKEDSQRGARMALLTTASTGLLLLVGVVLLHQVFGTFELSAIVSTPVPAGREGLLTAAFLCCFVGIAGKSAQFPFHYWLPNAMAAPTPVSAYLHSATMVKLGVFLTARLLPVFNGLDEWTPVLTGFGFGTLLVGAVLALLSQDLKAVLAYTTVAQLGLLVGYYGLFSQGLQVTWDYLHIVNHVFYKACLFMVVGTIDHATGTRDQRELGGLFRAMPMTGVAALIGAASLAGLPPTSGFLSKEMLLKSLFAFREIEAGLLGWWPLLAVLVASLLKVTIAVRFVHRVFFGRMPANLRQHFHAPVVGLELPPLLLALAALGGGLWATGFGQWTLSFAVPGSHAVTAPDLHLWHGLTREFVASVAVVLGGIVLYVAVGLRAWERAVIPNAMRLDRSFERVVDAVPYVARSINRRLGFETPQAALMTTVAAMLAAVAAGALITREAWAPLSSQWEFWPGEPGGWARWGVVLMVSLAALAATVWRQPIRQLFALSISGIGVTAFFVFYRAPDLALTQMLVEAITLLLVLLVVLRLRRDGADREPLTKESSLFRGLRITLSVGFGLLLGGSVLFFQQPRGEDWAGNFYLQNSVPLAKGTNAVNTIVIDFRGWDTLLEIVVLLIASLGVLGLLARRRIGTPRPLPLASQDIFPVPPDQILRAVAIGSLVPLNLFALFLFFRGHNLPGGGFIAGLVTALSLLLLVFVWGVSGLRRRLPFDPMILAVAGVSLALAVTLLPTLAGLPMLNHLHFYLGSFYAGSPLFFDLGVYGAVVGVSLKLILPLMNSVHRLPALAREQQGTYMSEMEEPIDLPRPDRTDDHKEDRT
jgi:NADH:ubiquinone oxidoreductase subunit 5 (subunit L)/multisubunit Na+/H+ antiporter MnhA subunit/multisubunit Na+/H+ antiporter MnhB subunit